MQDKEAGNLNRKIHLAEVWNGFFLNAGRELSFIAFS